MCGPLCRLTRSTSFQVQTNGYSAVYEGQGVMNYTSKQGGAKYHGSVYEFFRNTELDTWGWFGKIPNPATGLPVKPVEHSNEYGINLSGPLVPFGAWKEKVFYYGNYNGFRYSSATPTPMTFPTLAQKSGDFSATGLPNIYDPSTQASCTAHNTTGYPCRYQFGYGPPAGTTKGANGLPTATGAAVNVIPSSKMSTVAQNMQALLPTTGISTALQNNYVAPNATGLINWSMTHRLDYIVDAKDTLTLIATIGRQASSNPVGQTTAGRNVGPVPFNYGQTYAPRPRWASLKRRTSSRRTSSTKSSGAMPAITVLPSILTRRRRMPRQPWASPICRPARRSRPTPSWSSPRRTPRQDGWHSRQCDPGGKLHGVG